MAFHNSLRGTMKVVAFHESSNKLRFELDRKHVFNKSKSNFNFLKIPKFSRSLTYCMSLFCCICSMNTMLLNQM
jgi:hypothetical protein